MPTRSAPRAAQSPIYGPIQTTGLEELKKTQKTDSEAHGKEAEEIEKLSGAVSKLVTNSARHMKKSLQSIDTTDRYYLNYDKCKFEAFIAQNLEATKTDEPLLDEDKIIELTRSKESYHIIEERTKQFEAHFNDDYKAFQTRLESADGWLAGQYDQPPMLPAARDYYDEFKMNTAKRARRWKRQSLT